MEDVNAAVEMMPHFDIEYQAFVKVQHANRLHVALLPMCGHAGYCNARVQGDDEDVATKLYDMCRAEEKKLRGESESDEDSDQDEYIPEDDEDEGPCV